MHGVFFPIADQSNFVIAATYSVSQRHLRGVLSFFDQGTRSVQVCVRNSQVPVPF